MASKKRVVPPTEVSPKAKRRRFTAAYKLEVLQAADECTEPGELGELLRREGLYSSHLAEWRKARAKGMLDGLTPKKRGPKPRERDERDDRIKQLEKEARHFKRRAERAEALVELQKKVAELFGETQTPSGDDD